VKLKDCRGDQKCDDKTTKEECAELCAAAAGCEYFTHGVGLKRGQCWQEWTTDGCESEEWEKDDYDFYQLLDDYYPPPLPPFTPGAAPRPPPSPGPPPPSPPPQSVLDQMKEKVYKAEGFLTGSLTGGLVAFAIVLAAACVAGAMYRAWAKRNKNERMGLTDDRSNTELTEAVDQKF